MANVNTAPFQGRLVIGNLVSSDLATLWPASCAMNCDTNQEAGLVENSKFTFLLYLRHVPASAAWYFAIRTRSSKEVTEEHAFAGDPFGRERA
jgi:hypothetical protein